MLISIVTISFNQAAFLRHLIHSVGEQLGPFDEHIIVDPGSTDGSRELIREAAAIDSRVKTILTPDKGPADGLNKGFGIAKGDVCGYINADDFLLPGAIDWVRAFFERSVEVDVLIGGIKIADTNNRLRRRGRVADRPSVKRIATGIIQYYQQGTYLRKKALDRINGFNVHNTTCWDYELIVDLTLAGCNIATTSRPLGVFRIHGASITGKGTNADFYRKDKDRLRAKAQAVCGAGHDKIIEGLLRCEARLNPVRIVQQFRSPVSR